MGDRNVDKEHQVNEPHLRRASGRDYRARRSGRDARSRLGTGYLYICVVPQFDARQTHRVWRPLLTALEARTGPWPGITLFTAP